MAALRAGPMGAECDPYLSWAEGQPVPIAPEAVVRGTTPKGEGAAVKPWWKVW